MSDALRRKRKLAVVTVKRDLILTAAKTLFAENGLDGTSVRDIACLAGYTTGAIYFHYANKEELYAAILQDSLDRLFVLVSDSVAGSDSPLSTLPAAFRALVGFYAANPHDLDLSLYLLGGARPRGLTPALNKVLNGKLRAVLGIYRQELLRAGVRESELNVEVAGLFDEMIGALVAANTGRLKVIGTDLKSVVDHHTSNLITRLSNLKR